jgi:hypothetical protein
MEGLASTLGDHELKFEKNVGTTLLVALTVGELYGPKALSLVEAARARVCLKRVEPDWRFQDSECVAEEIAADTLAN